MLIRLNKNKGFCWQSNNNIYFKGYVYYENHFLTINDIVNMFQDLELFDHFSETVLKLNGCFSIVITKNDSVWAATDKARSFPLYYSVDKNILSDDVDKILEYCNYSESDYDDISITELILSSFVYGNNTAYKKIKQLDLGQSLEFNGLINLKYYYRHLHKSRKEDRKKLIEEFINVSEQMFDRLIRSLDNRTIILPLSGGYDSRYIAAMLKKKNYDKIICYTYGNKDSYEVNYSREVAEKLGFRWYFVEYSKTKWCNLIDDAFKDYCHYAHNYTTIPHIQEYIALKELKYKGLLPNDGIVVTGFCGDLPAGSFVLSEKDKDSVVLEFDWISSYIFKENYTHFESTKMQNRLIKERIKECLKNISGTIDTFEDFMNQYETWFTGARPSKWVVNSNRVYEYFGLEWRMPLWDNEFLNFWYKVDNKERLNSKLYIDVLFNWLFEHYKIDLLKPRNIRLLSVEYKNSVKRKIKLTLLRIINYVFIKTGICFLKSINTNNYRILARIVLKKIKSKRIITYRNINAHQMMALWWTEEIYGVKIIKRLFVNE